MLEYNKLAYIDMQKTGSTTIVNLLRDIILDEVKYKKTHGPVPTNYETNKLCFISVREPLSLYISLFKFGAGEKRGQLRASLSKKGRVDLYEPSMRGFERWLEFLLDPNNAKFLDRKYAKFSPFNDIGLISYRLVYMSVPDSLEKMKKLEAGNRKEIKKLLKRKRVYQDYVRTENLNDDVFHFLKRNENNLIFKHPLTTSEDLIEKIGIRNISTKIEGMKLETISKELRDRVIDREWLFYKEFCYVDSPLGVPSSQNPRFNKHNS